MLWKLKFIPTSVLHVALVVEARSCGLEIVHRCCASLRIVEHLLAVHRSGRVLLLSTSWLLEWTLRSLTKARLGSGTRSHLRLVYLRVALLGGLVLRKLQLFVQVDLLRVHHCCRAAIGFVRDQVTVHIDLVFAEILVDSDVVLLLVGIHAPLKPIVQVGSLWSHSHVVVIKKLHALHVVLEAAICKLSDIDLVR